VGCEEGGNSITIHPLKNAGGKNTQFQERKGREEKSRANAVYKGLRMDKRECEVACLPRCTERKMISEPLDSPTVLARGWGGVGVGEGGCGGGGGGGGGVVGVWGVGPGERKGMVGDLVLLKNDQGEDRSKNERSLHGEKELLMQDSEERGGKQERRGSSLIWVMLRPSTPL